MSHNIHPPHPCPHSRPTASSCQVLKAESPPSHPLSLCITSRQTLQTIMHSSSSASAAMQLKASAIRRMRFINYDDGQHPGKNILELLQGNGTERRTALIRSDGRSAAAAPLRRPAGTVGQWPSEGPRVPGVTSAVEELDLSVLAWTYTGLLWVRSPPTTTAHSPGPQGLNHMTEQQL